MEREQKSIRLPALGLAVAIALVITLGVPAAMVHGAGSTWAVDASNVTQASGESGSIHVVAQRDRGTGSHWLSFGASKRAG